MSKYQWANDVDLSSLIIGLLQRKHCKCYMVQFLVSKQFVFLGDVVLQTNKCRVQGGFNPNNQIQINGMGLIMVMDKDTMPVMVMHPNLKIQICTVMLLMHMEIISSSNVYLGSSSFEDVEIWVHS